MSEENANEQSDSWPKNDLLHPVTPEMIEASGLVEDGSRRGDIWWLFHWELTVKASMVEEAAKQLAEAVGNVYDQSPDEELSKIKTILEQNRIERNLKEVQEHFEKMRELLKTVREMQDRIF